jgi:Arc/MetJ-type ribon-helix-helix transcriptional regulator
MKTEKKITVHVPEELLDRAREQTGRGITETVRQGLRLVAAGDTYRKLRGLRGKVSIEIDLPALREDRR